PARDRGCPRSDPPEHEARPAPLKPGVSPMRIASTKGLLEDPGRAWAPFAPDRSRPWDREAVAHLHRRAGFAAPWAVLERDVKDGPEASVDRLLAGEAVAG